MIWFAVVFACLFLILLYGISKSLQRIGNELSLIRRGEKEVDDEDGGGE